MRRAVCLSTGVPSSILQFVRTVIAQHSVDPGQQVGSTGADGLEMMLAVLHHLPVVDGCDLGVPLTSNAGIEKCSGLDQVGTGLGHAQASGLGIATLTAERDQARPAEEVTQGRETLDVTDEGDVYGGTVLAYPAECLQV